jgi:trans-aconitate methyltransferase
MSAGNETLNPAYFDSLYAQHSDPWRFATSDYERGKYALTLDALPKARYEAAGEIGCSIGVLTRSLALRCERLLAVDASSAPLTAARQRCVDRPNVTFKKMFVPAQWPTGLFDLFVLSEVVYYLNKDDVALLASKVLQSLKARGDIVMVHWTGLTDYPLTGDEAAELFIACTGAATRIVRRERYEAFRLDVVSRI